jgi:hypothetical protein
LANEKGFNEADDDVREQVKKPGSEDPYASISIGGICYSYEKAEDDEE